MVVTAFVPWSRLDKEPHASQPDGSHGDESDHHEKCGRAHPQPHSRLMGHVVHILFVRD